MQLEIKSLQNELVAVKNLSEESKKFGDADEFVKFKLINYYYYNL